MTITRTEVAAIARLARLDFSALEMEVLADQMTAILQYMRQLDELDTDGVPPMAHAMPQSNVFRPDEARQRITREEALRNAPDAGEAFFRVPRVIE